MHINSGLFSRGKYFTTGMPSGATVHEEDFHKCMALNNIRQWHVENALISERYLGVQYQ